MERIAVDETTGCWVWQGARTKQGHGIISNGFRRNLYVHRVMYEHANGVELPPGIKACHRCDNPPCCNPGHLFPGTLSDNMRDMVKKGRHGAQKLQPEQIGEIRARLQSGVTQREVGREFGIAQQTVSEIKTGKIWSVIE